MNINLIKELYGSGFSIKKISKTLDISSKQIKEIIVSDKLEIIKETFDLSKIDHLMDLYSKGVSAKNLGIKYSIDKRRVLKWAKARNILRSKSESHRFTHFREDSFDSINTPTKAYWLGFFYADAYNCYNTCTVTVNLSAIDGVHLEKLSDFLSLPKDKITTHSSTINNKAYYHKSVKIYSKHICNTLKNHGCPQNKSFIITYPEFLSSDLNVHFIRGLFDGDGSLCKNTGNNEWRFKLVSTKECLESIKQIILSSIGIEVNYNYISKTNNNTYEIVISGNERVLKASNWIYGCSNKNNRLERKYDKYRELTEQQKNRSFNRDNYKLTEIIKDEVSVKLDQGSSFANIAKSHKIHPRTVAKINQKKINDTSNKLGLVNSQIHNNVFVINGQKLTSAFFKNLSKDERSEWVEPIFKYLKENEFVFPDSLNKAVSDYNRLLSHEPDLSIDEVFNNSSMATYISKYFCKDFFNSTESGKKTVHEILQNDELLIKLIKNRLVINWHSSVNETFNISFAMIIQGMRSARMIPQISIFKPTVAKYICEKYSQPGDLVGDYSCGFGARMLGAVSSGRRYIGTDPLTTKDLKTMAMALEIDPKKYTLINSGSENFKYDENSLDLCYSSPPYYNQEVYSNDQSQAYNNGEEYFYNEYWKSTLENVQHGLKPGKWFGLNITEKYNKMINMAKDKFGEPTEIVKLRTVRSHLSKTAGTIKYEPVFMFKNIK